MVTFTTVVNKEDRNKDLIGDVDWVLYDFGGREEERKRGGWEVPVFGHLFPKNWDLAKSCHSNCRVLPTRLNHI